MYQRRDKKHSLAKAQIALEKQEYVVWNAGICPSASILWKTGSTRKISLECTIGCWVIAENNFQYGGRLPS